MRRISLILVGLMMLCGVGAASAAAKLTTKTCYRPTTGAKVQVTSRKPCSAYGLSAVPVATIPASTVVAAPATIAVTTVPPAPAAPAATTAPPATTAPAAKETIGQSNARKSAESYLRSSSFSRLGLVDQLIYEGFTEADSTYAVDAVKVNWNEQAAKTAASYLRTGSFSKKGLYDQLIYEKFTPEQAAFGVASVGY
jgi:Host cell surface-exposed lipoprotein